ncbi:MAG: hypothetical protein HYS14_00255 [Candidatus Rokubacteria bacterium]|nr:hypothetical protein [Candidatus Rokubacteria bacterium]
MSYEDAVRVTELKTRPERFARIRTEMRMTDGQVLRVTDFLKPDIDEIYGVLPHALVGRFARWAERRWPGEKRPAFAQKVRTTRFAGFLRGSLPVFGHSAPSQNATGGSTWRLPFTGPGSNASRGWITP